MCMNSLGKPCLPYRHLLEPDSLHEEVSSVLLGGAARRAGLAREQEPRQEAESLFPALSPFFSNTVLLRGS